MTVENTVDLPPVEAVVPHRPPMVLLDRLTRVDPPRMYAEVQLSEESLFVRNGKARTMVTIEYLAQGVAAYVGLHDLDKGEDVEIGYLIGIRDMRLFTSHVCAGDLLEVETEHVWGDSKLGSFKGVVRRGGEIVSQATLTVFRGSIPEGAS